MGWMARRKIPTSRKNRETWGTQPRCWLLTILYYGELPTGAQWWQLWNEYW
jgi:hypothetical protein